MTYRILKQFPDYELYSDGSIWRREHRTVNGSNLRRMQIKPYVAKNKYLVVCIHDAKCVRVQKYLHRLIYEAFFGEIPTGYEIDHIDGDRQNCATENLRLSTHKANTNNPMGIERYKIANAIEKGKYNRERLIKAQSKEAYNEAVKVYLNLVEKRGSCGVWLLMKEAHVGYPRACKIVKSLGGGTMEMDGS